MGDFTLDVNGKQHRVTADPDMPLLYALRDDIGLNNPKFGCGLAQCGACTVHLDGLPRRSCVAPIGSLEGGKVTTIEGLESREARAVQTAWAALDGPQCGYGQSGQIMTAAALLAEIPKPDDDAIDAALAGNICRCATYVRIRAAIHLAARELGA